MSPDTDIVDRDQQILGELAELDMALARHVHARALATDDPAQVADLSRAYQRISRSVRQTLALKAKLKREADQHARWLAARSHASAPLSPIQRRRIELESAVARVIVAERETERPDWDTREDELFETMERRLDFRIDRGDIGRGSLDDDVVALCADLGLVKDNALRWRDLPELDDWGDPEDTVPEPRRSSG